MRGVDIVFSINIKGLYWIDKDPSNQDDLCLHGDVRLNFANKVTETDCTVSAASLYLLRTLTEDRIANDFESDPILPCCGNTLIASEDGESVTIIGCPNGIDWEVKHINNDVKLILGDGTEVQLELSEYQRAVFSFVDEVQSFYKQSLPRRFSNDALSESDRKGYHAFWKEWSMRRGISCLW